MHTRFLEKKNTFMVDRERKLWFIKYCWKTSIFMVIL